ncbi:MAG: hypothetical protein Q7T82_14215 [Armatimonadota bacterium]|nr:hypothetical protein [Armatimonadota bacterium]
MELNPIYVNIVATIAIAAGLILAGWWIAGLYWVHSRKEEKELPEVELPANLHEVFTGVPPVLVMFYLFITISAIAYVLYIWLSGVTY